MSKKLIESIIASDQAAHDGSNDGEIAALRKALEATIAWLPATMRRDIEAARSEAEDLRY
ncbi:hypothetical protein [Branchiibius sp. NY16-3462-2]|uniref:hypothetical protein n=1 Tax=Branchiibius sp. NY16-3462-2 TaxID=1807500 RepID=UPI0007923391|nr:hypothetical protein [Branchiibius sp. NY16-3462-2]KYH44782.1 hypothetical protein AZH51_12205 [Branchiibius sp. NY16-3462-2]